MMNPRRQLLIDAVEHLAAEPTAQQSYLVQLGFSDTVDELALEFDDTAAARNDMLAVNELTAEEHRVITLITELLAAMGGESNAHLWTPEALSSNRKWIDVREQARECLRLMKQME